MNRFDLIRKNSVSRAEYWISPDGKMVLRQSVESPRDLNPIASSGHFMPLDSIAVNASRGATPRKTCPSSARSAMNQLRFSADIRLKAFFCNRPQTGNIAQLLRGLTATLALVGDLLASNTLIRMNSVEMSYTDHKSSMVVASATRSFRSSFVVFSNHAYKSPQSG